MKRYTKEFITEAIRESTDTELLLNLRKLLYTCEKNIITDFEAVRAAVRLIDEYEGRKADEEAERDFNEYEAEYGADGAEWRRRGGSAW